jgi:PAN domain
MRLRHLMIASTFIVASALPSTIFADTIDPPNTDRPGNDYRNFDVRDSDACRSACLKELRCEAWTFVKRGIQGPSARCWLKDKVPKAVANPCCRSGTRAGIID